MRVHKYYLVKGNFGPVAKPNHNLLLLVARLFVPRANPPGINWESVNTE
jgi:hypothetical protein